MSSKPWLEHYDPGVPRSIGQYPEKTLVEFVRERARQRPFAIAVTFKGRSVTIGELDRASDALAHALLRLGVKRGDRVGLVLPNCPQFLIAEIAAWKLGAIVAPQNPMYTDRELEESLRQSSPETVVTLTPFYDRVKRCQRAAGVRRVIATSIKEYLPPLLRLAFVTFKEKKDGHRIELHPGDKWLQDLIHDGMRHGAFVPQTRLGDPAMILMSGGTTGTPKGAMSDHRSLIITGTQISAWLHDPIGTPGASIMLPLPLFHSYAACGVQCVALINGMRLILVPNPRDIGDVVQTIEREKPVVFCGVPTLFNALLANKRVAAGKADFRSIRASFSGAAALMAETKRRFEEVTGGRIIEGYALTESTLAATITPFAGATKIGSVGMPLPDVDVQIVDAEDAARELPAGEIGEIVFRAPQLMRGYRNNDAETATVLRDGALYTGDLGYFDEDGYLFIVDRKKDLIKTSGMQVWPREIEEVLATHPAVAEVGAAGVPDARRGEVPVAWVVRRDGVTVTAEELLEHCRANLARFKVPARIEFRTELPKTLVGKVLRRALVAEVALASSPAGTAASSPPASAG